MNAKQYGVLDKQTPFDLGKLGEKIALHFLEDN